MDDECIQGQQEGKPKALEARFDTSEALIDPSLSDDELSKKL